VREIHGTERVEAVTIFDNRTGEATQLACDAVFALLGFKPDLGPIAGWGLDVVKNRVKVSPMMETNVPGIYAAGDLVDYPGKLDLIAAGFAEAAIAANQAVHFLDPAARVSPGHSTAAKAFKDK
jgi:thioredoxin reductase (NADPH)